MIVALLYVTLVVGIALPQSSLPIGYEFSAEISFPVHESVANGLMLFISQVISNAFYISFAVLTYGSTSVSLSPESSPRADSSHGTTTIAGAGSHSNGSVFEKNASLLWWFSVAMCLVSTLSLLPVRSSYRRLALDSNEVNAHQDHNVTSGLTDVALNHINDVLASSKPESDAQVDPVA